MLEELRRQIIEENKVTDMKVLAFIETLTEMQMLAMRVAAQQFTAGLFVLTESNMYLEWCKMVAKVEKMRSILESAYGVNVVLIANKKYDEKNELPHEAFKCLGVIGQCDYENLTVPVVFFRSSNI